MRKKSYKYAKLRLLDKNGKKGVCHYCKAIFKAEDLTIDHKKPLCLGGYNKMGNYVLACAPCNSKKGNMPYEEYMKKLRLEELQSLCDNEED